MDPSQRLLALEQILASSPGVSISRSSSDLVETMLEGVLAQRIRQTTSLLERTGGANIDEADLVAMRLLLADYAAAVSHLRAATRLTDERLGRAATSIKADGRRVGRRIEEATRREDARAARDHHPSTTS